ncbi:uncharacterized protein [Rutidosis leptorrhynchoides]|uniref:uncharacterized protein n=1 Tax=Rutidosis leptorrhynchoides TaxID=125765 RepID=UPI003A99A11F
MAIKSLWGNFHFKFASSSASGCSGGIITLWDPHIFLSKRVISFANVLIVEGSFHDAPDPCFLINIYAPQSKSGKKRIWDFLHNFIALHQGNFILFGDFNAVRYPHERYGSRFSASVAADLNNFIVDSGLIDVPLGGRDFTRFNKSCTQRAKLDRFLISNSFLNRFPDMVGMIHSNLWSDHCLITLTKDSSDYGPIPFKLLHSWFKHDGFENIVQTAWNDINHTFHSNPQINFKNKLKHVKDSLKVWIKERRMAADGEKKSIIANLSAIDAQIDQGITSSTLAQDRSNALFDVHHLEQDEMANMAKKNWKLYHNLGDENSSFFHSALNRKRKKMQVTGIMNHGTWTTDPLQVKTIFLDSFVNKFKKQECVTINSPSPHLKKISGEDANYLISDFTDNEIKDAV